MLQDEGTERLLLLTRGVLTGASAMELRAVLLAAAQAQTWRSAQLTLQEVAQSTAALRTMGNMLLPRLEEASVEESMAAAMLAQGGSVAQLTQELEDALQPLSAGPIVRCLTLSMSTQVFCCLHVYYIVPAWNITQAMFSLYFVSISELHDMRVNAASQGWVCCVMNCVWYMQGSDEAGQMLPSIPRRDSLNAQDASASDGAMLTGNSESTPLNGILRDSGSKMAPTDGSSIQTLRSFDVADSATLNDAPVSISADPSRALTVTEELRFADCSECSLDNAADAANWLILRSIDDSEEAMLISEGDALCFGESDAWRRQEEEAEELLPRPEWRQAPTVTVLDGPPVPPLDGSLISTLGPGRQICNVLDVVAQAVAPVKKLCDVVGVELVLLSSSLLLTVNQLLGRSSGSPSLPGAVRERSLQHGTLISVANADSAGRAISHVLDASLQRLGKKGRLLVDIHGGSETNVQVLIADTGTEMLSELIGGGSTRPAGHSAQDAMERMSIGMPVGSGEMGIRIAERLLRENGGSVAVGSWKFDDKEYVRTTVTFQAGSDLSVVAQ